MYNTNIRYFHLTFIRVQLCLLKSLKSNATELSVEEREFRPGVRLQLEKICQPPYGSFTWKKTVKRTITIVVVTNMFFCGK